MRQAGVVVPGGVAHNSQYSTETVTVNCNANEKAISAGTGWSDDAADRELWTQRHHADRHEQRRHRLPRDGRQRQRQLEHFTLYVLCYVG